MGTGSVCIELMKRNNYWKYWKALDYDFDNYEAAIKIGKAIVGGNDDYVMMCFGDLFDQIAIDLSGIDEEQYYENPDTPIWESEDWVWNEEDQEWEHLEED